MRGDSALGGCLMCHSQIMRGRAFSEQHFWLAPAHFSHSFGDDRQPLPLSPWHAHSNSLILCRIPTHACSKCFHCTNKLVFDFILPKYRDKDAPQCIHPRVKSSLSVADAVVFLFFFSLFFPWSFVYCLRLLEKFAQLFFFFVSEIKAATDSVPSKYQGIVCASLLYFTSTLRHPHPPLKSPRGFCSYCRVADERVHVCDCVSAAPTSHTMIHLHFKCKSLTEFSSSHLL